MKAIILVFQIFYLLCFQVFTISSTERKPIVTYVTGLWDVNRGNLDSKFTRSYQYYLTHFAELLQTQSNLIIYGDNHLQEFVKQHRSKDNTVFIQRELEWFNHQWYTSKIEKIINNLNQTDHKKFLQYQVFPQYGLKMYNPVVMSKLFLMTEALNFDIFDSDYLLWVDGGFTHVLDKKLIVPSNNTLQRIPLYFQGPFFFQTNDWNQLKHGFKNEGERYVKKRVVDFVWANYIGGRIEAISTMLSIYQNFKRITLQNLEMWTDESVFSLMLIRYPYFLVSINNLTLQKFESFRFHTPKYHPNQQLRYFNFSEMMEKKIYIHRIETSQKLILLKTTQNQEKLRERLQYSCNKQKIFQQELFNSQKLNYLLQELIILGGVNLIFLGIYVIIKCEMRKVSKQQYSRFQI